MKFIIYYQVPLQQIINHAIKVYITSIKMVLRCYATYHLL